MAHGSTALTTHGSTTLTTHSSTTLTTDGSTGLTTHGTIVYHSSSIFNSSFWFENAQRSGPDNWQLITHNS
jgi:hypothetical protein